MKLDMQMPDKVFGVEVSLLKVFLLPLGLVLVFLFSLSLVLMPKFEEIGQMRKETGEVKRKKNLVEEKRDYLLTVDEQELIQRANFLAGALLREKDAYVLVGVIRKVAVGRGFYIQSFSVSPGEMTGEGTDEAGVGQAVAEAIPISFVVAGPREKYLDLVLALEKTLPVLSVDSFDMSGSGQMVELDLRVSAFYVSEKSEFSAVDVSLADLMLSDDEERLVARLSGFEEAGPGNLGEGEISGDFVDYARTDPFNL